MATSPPPRSPRSSANELAAPAAPETLNLAVLLAHDGVSIKTSGGNIAPGCNGVGAGLAVPNAAGKRDVPAVVGCVRKVRAASPKFAAERSYMITASPDTPIREIADIVVAMRGAPGDGLMPQVYFGVSR